MDNASRTPRRKSPLRPSPPRPEAIDGADSEIDLGGLARHLGYALKRAQLRVFDDFRAAVEPLDLSPAQFSVLMLLEANPGRNQTEIAATLGILRPNFVTLLDALEARGLCSRTRSLGDRRSHVLALTAKGRTVLTTAKRLIAERHEDKLSAILTADERRLLQDLLGRVAKLL
jgi:DNA-binding MarR family transcriptional regulator